MPFRRAPVDSSAERSYWAELRQSFAPRQRMSDDEVALTGVVSGMLWLAGGITLLPLMFLPGVPTAHRSLLVGLAVAALVLGVGSTALIDWRRTPVACLHVTGIAAIVMIAVGVSATGGARSACWVYLFFIALFGSYSFAPRVAIGYVVLATLAHGLPLLYDPRATHGEFLAVWLLASTGYWVLGAAMIAAKTMMAMHRGRAERLAALHGALRQVATAVVDGADEEAIYALVARQIAELIGGGAAGIMRLDTPQSMTVMGSWADHPDGCYPTGTLVPVRPGSDVEQALEGRHPVRLAGHAPNSPVGRLGYSESLVAPVRVAGATWGLLAVAAGGPRPLSEADERRVMAFGDLLATAIRNLEDRAKLAAQALSDPLTGLANHRRLHDGLRTLMWHSQEGGEPVTVAVLDIDHFKQINDIGGHELGDEILVRVADALRRLAGPEDILSRAGGDEFTWVMPGIARHEALVRVQAARRLITARGEGPYRVTLSAGICDTAITASPDELIRLADGALYWSKAHGRDQAQVYDAEVIDELSAHDRAERLERSQALVGLRALARAIDAKDPATREHSERVAHLAGRLACAVGWPADRAQLLSDAALVHDVGKIGIDDAVLRKPGRLSGAERAHVNAHAELSARIVDGVLSAEQVQWIRSHHERPDGGGYPLGLFQDAIPLGGALLAVADAFDVMTVGRPYSARRSLAEALAECRALTGAQFSPVAVAALEQVAVEREWREIDGLGDLLATALP